MKTKSECASVENPIIIRAAVIACRRADWMQHRAEYSLSVIAADFDLGKSAKISTEMLAIRQKTEHAAYGFDAETEGAPTSPSPIHGASGDGAVIPC